MDELKTLAGKLYDISDQIIKRGIELSDDKPSMLNYDEQRKSYYVNQLRSTLKRLNQIKTEETKDIIESLKEDPKELKQKAAQLMKIARSAPQAPEIGRIPEDISREVHMDVSEMQRCLENGCYRSVVILCGRLMEIALHRRYYDVTGQDILEKNPGIGLGKLIAKLKEKEITFPPGLTQQIHLINQVRVHSVHKKQDAFYPSKDQAQAIMLYTLDVLRQIFS